MHTLKKLAEYREKVGDEKYKIFLGDRFNHIKSTITKSIVYDTYKEDFGISKLRTVAPTMEEIESGFMSKDIIDSFDTIQHLIIVSTVNVLKEFFNSNVCKNISAWLNDCNYYSNTPPDIAIIALCGCIKYYNEEYVIIDRNITEEMKDYFCTGCSCKKE